MILSASENGFISINHKLRNVEFLAGTSLTRDSNGVPPWFAPIPVGTLAGTLTGHLVRWHQITRDDAEMLRGETAVWYPHLRANETREERVGGGGGVL